MKVIKIFLFFVLTSASVMSCLDPVQRAIDKASKRNATEIQEYISKGGGTFQSTSTGIYYRKLKTNDTGTSAKEGEQALIYYKFYLLSGLLVDSATSASGKPVGILYAQNGIFEGLYTAIGMLKTGEKGEFLIPSEYAFQDQSFQNVPAWSVIRAEVEVVDFRNEEEQINAYVKDKGLTNVEVTSTGLRFIKQTAAATGAEVKSGDKVSVKYTGKFLNDKTFNSGTFDFTTGKTPGEVIKGFEEAVLKLKVGEKATVIFPSSLGYGTSSNGTIPPYTPLLFDIEVTAKL